MVEEQDEAQDPAANRAADRQGPIVCVRCNDTHLVLDHEEGRTFMCTSCPTPCDVCRVDPATKHRGAYCFETPCRCACHDQPPDQVSKLNKPRENYMLFVQGFGHGAAMKALIHPDRPAYCEGYMAGRQARAEAVGSYCDRIGYEPTVLRI